MKQQVVGLFLLCGLMTASPVARIGHPGGDRNFNEPEFKPATRVFLPSPKDDFAGHNEKALASSHVEQHHNNPFNGNFIPLPLSPIEHLHGGPQLAEPHHQQDVAAQRSIETPLFFDTVEHGHIVVDYADRRQDLTPMRFRSIRPDFPFSDIQQARGRF